MFADEATILEILTREVSLIEPLKVEYTTSLRQELELDSLDLAVFMLAVQEKYNIKISDEELEELDNISEIVQRVNGLLN
tara:strand:- start:110 stop:349 length:240 start_codon:yes stop_codon:yes gene_type:complete